MLFVVQLVDSRYGYKRKFVKVRAFLILLRTPVGNRLMKSLRIKLLIPLSILFDPGRDINRIVLLLARSLRAFDESAETLSCCAGCSPNQPAFAHQTGP